MLSKDRYVQILGLYWYFVPHGTLGSDRVKRFVKSYLFVEF